VRGYSPEEKGGDAVAAARRATAARTAEELGSGLDGAAEGFFLPEQRRPYPKGTTWKGGRGASAVRRVRHRPSDNKSLLSFVGGKGRGEMTVEIGRCWFL
jgi:hypothetical protein